MRILVSIFFFLFVTESTAQINLVPNPSFESFSLCPTSFSQITLAFPWMQPSLGTPDYFNVCNSGVVSIPINAFGNQFARTGDAYAGFEAYTFSTDYREYIETPLSLPLLANEQYCIEFYLSLADTATYSISNIGVYFSTDSLFDNTTFSPFNVMSQVNNPLGNYLSDKNNWIKISGIYKAFGGEKYMTIGNFLSDINSDTSWVGPDPFFFGSPYYYIDDISVFLCDTGVLIPNVFTPNNDNTNDLFKITSNNLKTLNCKIYDRWGILVGELNGSNDSWDGRTRSGLECPDGVYYYIFSAKGKDEKEYNEKGFIQLVR